MIRGVSATQLRQVVSAGDSVCGGMAGKRVRCGDFARPTIPVRGCIPVEGVPARGPNPRQGIHRTVWLAAVHRRLFFEGAKVRKICTLHISNHHH